ncbi:hypothetical protein LTR78_000475 [Recurvomyces mirabilis]|uniref:Thioesterase/thiol ester dehydrase-isomerase n=1 Tax=Recurvomyces mirabilis TaxID=574656 RepID=A0AAE0WY05_9PEZI|nr:hypothetical protein LTR78_000475 [Recurvomyces mirabilis]KAK5162130.1 hypothetical protein LTS14_000476 [Recurvomyces mirabilis]
MHQSHGGNTYLPFQDLVAVEQVDERTFRSIALPFQPGGAVGKKRAYGGHVFMQAAWAACHTVADGFVLHNVTGNFILPGLTDIPFIYKVHIIRDGRSYSTRIVNVTQARGKGICFTCTCSFKNPETSPLDVQESVNIWEKYSSILSGKKPSDFEECPGMDVPWYWKRRKETGVNEPFPGLQMHKVDMDRYNEPLHPLDRRQLIMYRTLDNLPRDPNLHLCAHLYASDRNSLFIVANHLDMGDTWTQMGTLAHTVIFHAAMNDLWFGPSTSQDSPLDSLDGRWYCKEDWSDRAGSGRAMFHSKVWAASGRHVATVVQDGMIRLTKDPVATEDERRALKKLETAWKPRL